jgi:hypothetical protein
MDEAPAVTADDLHARLVAEHGAHPSNVGFYSEWVPVIDRLDKDLTALVPGYRLVLVKSKFGGLRYYVDWPAGVAGEDIEKARALIEAAEQACYEATR